jgi:hypothetical protein
MSTTLYGQISDELGHALWTSYSFDGRFAERSITASAQPAQNFLTRQASVIYVDVGHDPDKTCGRLAYLERSYGKLYGVAVISKDFDLPDSSSRLYWSAETVGRRRFGSPVHTDLELRSLAITANPAGVALAPLQSLRGSILCPEDRVRWKSPPQLIRRACEFVREYRRGDPLTIAEPDAARAASAGRHAAERSGFAHPDSPPAGAGPLIIRDGGRILSVR